MPSHQGGPCGPGPLDSLGTLDKLGILTVELGSQEGLGAGPGRVSPGDGLAPSPAHVQLTACSSRVI